MSTSGRAWRQDCHPQGTGAPLADKRETSREALATYQTVGAISTQWRRLPELSPWRFVRAIWIIDLFSIIPIYAIVSLLDRHYHFFGPDVPGASLLEKWGALPLFLVAVVIAPLVETFIGQGLPWLVTRLLRLPHAVFLLFSTVWFAWLHGVGFHGADFWVMVVAHLIAAFLLAFTYLQGRKHSRWRAIWMTASVHMLANLTVAVAYMVTRFRG
jgi:hypothetical protein